MVELPTALNRFADSGVRIFIKMPPPLSMKHFGAMGMLREASKQPEFKKKTKGWVPSSGNMGMVVGVVGRNSFGLKDVYSVVPADIAAGKLAFLKVAGVKTILDDSLPEGLDSMSYAKQMGSAADSVYFAQYEDQSNADGYDPLFDQIWQQLNGDVAGISFGCGTGGLGRCIAHRLGDVRPGAITIAAYSSSEDQLPGMRSKKRLKKVKLFEADLFSYVVEVSTYSGYRLSYNLCKHGLMLGPSSGASLDALLKTLTQLSRKGKLKAGNYVSIGHDTALVVLDKYSTQLRKEDFTSSG